MPCPTRSLRSGWTQPSTSRPRSSTSSASRRRAPTPSERWRSAGRPGRATSSRSSCTASPGSGGCAASWPKPASCWTAPSRAHGCRATSRALAGNLLNRSLTALAAGDLELALATAEESVDLTTRPGRGPRLGVGRARRWPPRSWRPAIRRAPSRSWSVSAGGGGAPAHPECLEDALPRAADPLLAGARPPRRREASRDGRPKAAPRHSGCASPPAWPTGPRRPSPSKPATSRPRASAPSHRHGRGRPRRGSGRSGAVTDPRRPGTRAGRPAKACRERADPRRKDTPRLRRAPLPGSGGTGTTAARPARPPANATRKGRRRAVSSRSRSGSFRSQGWSSTARRTPRSPQSSSSARRRSRATCTTCSTSSGSRRASSSRVPSSSPTAHMRCRASQIPFSARRAALLRALP